MKTAIMIDIVNALTEYLRDARIKRLVYKNMPYIYSTLPSQEDLYALHNKGAKLYRVDVASVVDLESPLEISRNRQRGAKKALSAGLKVVKNDDFKTFYSLLTETLHIRHNTKPIHSLSEMMLLASRFPQNISLYTTINAANSIFAGVLVFEMNHWVHIQCTGYTQEAQAMGALDLLHIALIKEYYKHKRFYTFGISTEDEGRVLNTGLIAQKEGFGGCAIVHNFLELEIPHDEY